MSLEVNVGEPDKAGWGKEVVSVADSMGKVRLRKLLGSKSIARLSGLVKTLAKDCAWDFLWQSGLQKCGGLGAFLAGINTTNAFLSTIPDGITPISHWFARQLSSLQLFLLIRGSQ